MALEYLQYHNTLFRWKNIFSERLLQNQIGTNYLMVINLF